MKKGKVISVEEYALAAMQGWLSSYGPDASFPSDTSCKDLAQYCFDLGRIMFKTSAKGGTPQETNRK